MAKRRMGIIAFLFCLYLCLVPCYAQAASTADATEPISPERECTLVLSYSNHGAVFSGLTVKLYRVADVSADFQYTLTKPFMSSGLILNGIRSTGEWNVIRSTLEAHILANQTEETLAATTDQSGQVYFDKLTPGLYLVSGMRVLQDGLSYSFESTLIALPGLDMDGRWQYQLTAAPKSEVRPLPTPDTPGTEEEIQFKVLKLWKGDEGQNIRPQSIEIEIFRDESSYQTAVLSEDNHWSYCWAAEDDGANWTVAERNVPAGYTVTTEERSTTFILTNTLTPDTPPTEEPTPEDPPSGDDPNIDPPKTGDTPHIMLYTMLMYVSGIILILLGLTGKRKRV